MKYSYLDSPACNMCGSENRTILGRRLNKPQGLNPKKRIGISTTVVRCDGCRLVYCDPLPVPESISDHYGVSPDDYWTPAQLEDRGDFTFEASEIRRITPGAKTFLDIGAGSGRTFRAASKHFDYHGIEPGPEFVKRIGSDRIQCASIETAEFPDGMFDVVYFGAVLEHLYDPNDSLQRAMGWLKPGGMAWAEVPSSDYLVSKLFNAYFRLRMTDYVVNVSPMHNPFHLYEFTLDSFVRNGQRNGYEVAHHWRYPGTAPVPSVINKSLAPIMNATKTGMGLVVYLRKL